MRSQPLFHSIVHCSGPLRSSRRLLATTFPAVDDAVGFGASRRALSISSPRIARTLLHSSRYGRTLPTTIREFIDALAGAPGGEAPCSVHIGSAGMIVVDLSCEKLQDAALRGR